MNQGRIEAIVEERWKDFEQRLEAFEKRDFQLQNQIDEIRKKIVVIEAVSRLIPSVLGNPESLAEESRCHPNHTGLSRIKATYMC